MTGSQSHDQNAVLRYVVPFCVFMSFLFLQKYGDEQTIFWIYAAKSVITAIAILILWRGHWREIEGKFDWKAVVLGLVVLVIWIAPEIIFPKEREIGFDPNVFTVVWQKWTAIFFRIAGAAIVVPIMEEIFWRSFVMRWIIKQEFLTVKLGAYTHASFWVTAAFFMAEHAMFQWHVAFICGILYGGYLVKTKNLVGCIIAHAVTNLGLGIYVVISGQWQHW